MTTPKGQPYSKYEVEYIKNHYANGTTRDIAKHLNRDVKSVQNKAYHLGLSRQVRYRWTEHETRWLENQYEWGTPLQDIMRQLCRDRRQIQNKVYQLGLKRPPEWIECEDEFLIKSLAEGKTQTEIGYRLGKSRTAVRYRIEKLKRRGVIK